MRLDSRPFASRDDLREMQSAMTAAWLSPRRPLVPQTIGDLAWWFASAGPDIDWTERIRIWMDGNRIIGWGWFKPPGDLDWWVEALLDKADERRVRLEILAWAEERGPSARVSGTDGGPPRPIEVWGADDWPETALLTELGYGPTGTELTQFFQSLDRELPEAIVPDGYTVRTVAGPSEIPARVEVHRAAFAPSKMTIEKYGILVGLEPYAYDLDAVVEAPDGTFAAFTMCWLDRSAQLGYFEPVGTHPDHQRRGLGKAVMTHGLRMFQEAGARDAMVYSEAANPASQALYRSVGFNPVAMHRAYSKPAVG